MKRCLDTCAYSRLMLGHPPLQTCLEEADVLLLPAIVLGELHAGFGAGARSRENEARLQAFTESPSVRIQDVTWDIARRYALLVNHLRRSGTPIPTNDIWIAASAMQYGLTVVTTDAHFLKIPQILVAHSSPAT
jgi:predicted nucleic acid-binding protein